MPDLFSDRCYRPDEVAAKLHVNIRTIYRHVNDIDDPLPSIRLAPRGPIRIPGSELNKWLERRRVNPLDA